MIFLIATFRKQILQQLVFRWSLVFEIISITAMLGVFFLIDHYQEKLFGGRIVEAITHLQTSYFGYVSLGIAVSSFASSSFSGVLAQLLEYRRLNIFEQIVASPISLKRWAITAGISNILPAFFRFFLILFVATAFLKLNIPTHNFLLSIIIIVLSLIPLWALSILSLLPVLVFRRGDPIGFFMNIAFELFSGVYVPVSLFPEKIQTFANFIPLTPAIKALQLVVYKNASFMEIKNELLMLLILGFIYLIISLYLLKWIDCFCRKKGTYFLS